MKDLEMIFNEVTDVRNSRGKCHCLSHILCRCVCGVLHGFLDADEIHQYVEAHEDWFKKRLDLWDGIPCSATFNKILSLVPA